MIRTFLCAILCVLGTQLNAQQTVSLNGEWKFFLAKDTQKAEELEDFYKQDFDASAFTTIKVPSNWEIQGFEEPNYRDIPKDGSVGFYLHKFTTPKGWDSKRIYLNFGGVWSACDVWLNGVFIDHHEGGYTSFRMAVDKGLKSQGENLLAVRVSQKNRSFKFDVFDDWSLSGIYRDVSIEAMPRDRWVESVAFKTTFDKDFCDADLAIKVMVHDRRNKYKKDIYKPNGGDPYRLRVTLKTPEGETLLTEEKKVDSHAYTSKETNLTIRMSAPLKWTAETPHLYGLTVELVEKSKVTQSYRTHVGFRQIDTDGGVLRINGQTVKLRGVNRHDEWPDVGRATTREHWLRDITLMKDANINFIRLSHYPHAKGFIDLCDSLGMYVGQEVSLGGGEDYFFKPSMMDVALLRTWETVSRDINNPSVIYWSVGNEDPLTQMHLDCIRLTKAIDPTRPVLIPWRFEQTLPEEVDILSVHYWTPGLYEQIGAKSTRPIISTEYTHAYGENGFGGLKERWEALTKYPSGAGAAIWMWADQGIRTAQKRPAKKNNIAHNDDPYLRLDGAGWDGIVDSDRNLTQDFHEAKSVYATVYPLVEQVKADNGQKEVKIPIQNDFDFTNLSAISVGWQIYMEKELMAEGTSQLEAEPHTSTTLNLPLDGIKEFIPGKTCYAWITFRNGEQTITQRAVEIIPSLPLYNMTEKQKIAVSESEGKTLVSCGDVEYVFDPQQGELAEIRKAGNTLATRLRPTIWRKLDHNEVTAMKVTPKKLPDLNNYKVQKTAWKVEQHEETVRIEATMKYVVNEKNEFDVQWLYTITGDGALNVRYETVCHVQVKELPHVGLSLQMDEDIKQLHWLGKGPYDSYSNRQSASYLGYWGGDIASPEACGTKQIRRIDLASDKAMLQISSNGYMEHFAASPSLCYILSGIYPRPEKGRPADDFFEQLHANQTFTGEIRIDVTNCK